MSGLSTNVCRLVSCALLAIACTASWNVAAKERRTPQTPHAFPAVPKRAFGFIVPGVIECTVGSRVHVVPVIYGASALPLSFSAQGLPPGSAFFEETGAFEVAPDAEGRWTITITAMNHSKEVATPRQVVVVASRIDPRPKEQ